MKYLNINKDAVFYRHLYVKLFMIFCISFILLLTILRCLFGTIFYKNISPSAPTGIYVMAVNQELKVNDYAIVSLPQDVPALKVEKGYPMIKKVQGFPGENYTVKSEALVFNDKKYKIFNLEGLPELVIGKYTVPENTILFLNDPEISFDSRYLGPIDQKYVLKKVNLLIPFEPFYNLF